MDALSAAKQRVERLRADVSADYGDWAESYEPPGSPDQDDDGDHNDNLDMGSDDSGGDHAGGEGVADGDNPWWRDEAEQPPLPRRAFKKPGVPRLSHLAGGRRKARGGGGGGDDDDYFGAARRPKRSTAMGVGYLGVAWPARDAAEEAAAVALDLHQVNHWTFFFFKTPLPPQFLQWVQKMAQPPTSRAGTMHVGLLVLVVALELPVAPLVPVLLEL